MITVKYVNSQNAQVTLHDNKLAWANLNTFRSYAWTFSTVTRPSGSGGIVSSFSRPPTTKTLQISVTANSNAALQEWVNALEAITEPDVENNTPGRVYVGAQYARGYITSVEVSEYNRAAGLAILSLGVLLVEPYWCTEIARTFYKTSSDTQNADGKTYPLRYPYKYLTAVGNTTINNTHYSPCPMRITIYGPCTSPTITMAGNVYTINVNVPSGNRLVIDQITHTVKLVSPEGASTNVFYARDKACDIFAALPAGESAVTWAGSFAFEVVIIKRRTGLEWL